MKKHYIKILLIIIINLLINETKAYKYTEQNKKKIENTYINKEYIKIQNLIKKEKYQNAINELKKINKKTYKETYKKQIQTYLIYTYYKNYQFEKAKSIILKFLKTYPNFKYIDYIIYMNGIINMELSYKKFSNFFILNTDEKDMSLMKISLKNFLKILKKYPNSIYKQDAEKRYIYIKNQLAKNELLISKFYFKKKEWKIVINRIKNMIYNYSDSCYTKKALLLMKYALIKNNLKKEAKIIKNIINMND